MKSVQYAALLGGVLVGLLSADASAKSPGKTSVIVVSSDGYTFSGWSASPRRLRITDSVADAINVSRVNISISPFGTLRGKFRVTQEATGSINTFIFPNQDGNISMMPVITLPSGPPPTVGVLHLLSGNRIVINCQVKATVQSGFTKWKIVGGGVCSGIDGRQYQLFFDSTP